MPFLVTQSLGRYNMLTRFVLILLAAILSACSVQVGPSAQDEQIDPGSAAQQEEVLAAAEVAAEMFDEGRFAESWSLVGPILESQTSPDAWALQVAMLRKPLGNAGQRTVKGFAFPNEMDGVPPGEYGLIGMSTEFANATAVEEKFVFQRVDGEWKLAGYWLSKEFTVGTPSGPN